MMTCKVHKPKLLDRRRNAKPKIILKPKQSTVPVPLICPSCSPLLPGSAPEYAPFPHHNPDSFASCPMSYRRQDLQSVERGCSSYRTGGRRTLDEATSHIIHERVPKDEVHGRTQIQGSYVPKCLSGTCIRTAHSLRHKAKPGLEPETSSVNRQAEAPSGG